MKKTGNFADTFRRLAKDILARCRREKRGVGRDLTPPKFTLGPELKSGRSRKKKLQIFKDRISQRRRLRKESFVPKASRQLVRKRMLQTAAIGLAITSFFAGGGPIVVGSMLSDISLFKVRSLEVEGVRSIAEKQIRDLSNITVYNSSLLELDLQAIEERIEQQPWVREVTVRRNWPSSVVIEVEEHRAVAMMNMTSQADPALYYVDRYGVAFMPVSSGEDHDFPVITGLDSIVDESVRQEIFREIMAFLKGARKNNPNLPVQSVSEVHINRMGEMVVYLVEYPFPIFFGKGETVTKFYRLLRVLESLYRDKQSDLLLSGVEYIRMDYLNNKVLVAQR